MPRCETPGCRRIVRGNAAQEEERGYYIEIDDPEAFGGMRPAIVCNKCYRTHEAGRTIPLFEDEPQPQRAAG